METATENKPPIFTRVSAHTVKVIVARSKRSDAQMMADCIATLTNHVLLPSISGIAPVYEKIVPWLDSETDTLVLVVRHN